MAQVQSTQSEKGVNNRVRGSDMLLSLQLCIETQKFLFAPDPWKGYKAFGK